MMSEKIPMTVLGRRLIEEELKRLITIERPDVIKAIEIARAHGDLSETRGVHAGGGRSRAPRYG